MTLPSQSRSGEQSETQTNAFKTNNPANLRNRFHTHFHKLVEEFDQLKNQSVKTTTTTQTEVPGMHTAT